MAGDKHGKTEKASPKRKREARERGQVPKSREVGMWAAVLAGSFALPAELRGGTARLRTLWAVVGAAASHPDEATATKVLSRGLGTVLVTVAPLAATMVVVAVAVNLAQVGFVVNRKALKPSVSRLNPIKGIKNLLSPTGLMSGLKSLLKMVLVAGLAWQMLRGLSTTLVQPGVLTAGTVAATAASRSIGFVRTVAAIGLILGVADYGWQRRHVNKSLMMTKQEVREETKLSEGNPQIKGAIRRRQMKMSRLRMMAEVARADTIVVNPTHVSVAIRYEAGRGAPVVLAKGVDEVAMAIREEAAKHRIPLIEDVPLARALWQVCEPGDEIPADLYEAVARVLAFLYRVKSSGHRPLAGAPMRLPAA